MWTQRYDTWRQLSCSLTSAEPASFVCLRAANSCRPEAFLFCECVCLMQKLFQFCMNYHLDSWMNLLEVGGQRSKVKVNTFWGLLNMISQENLQGMSSNMVQTFICLHRLIDSILVVKGQSSRSLWPQKTYLWPLEHYTSRLYFDNVFKLWPIVTWTQKLIRVYWLMVIMTSYDSGNKCMTAETALVDGDIQQLGDLSEACWSPSSVVAVVCP